MKGSNESSGNEPFVHALISLLECDFLARLDQYHGIVVAREDLAFR